MIEFKQIARFAPAAAAGKVLTARDEFTEVTLGKNVPDTTTL